MTSSGEPDGLIEFEGEISEEEPAELRERWERVHRGVDAAYRVAPMGEPERFVMWRHGWPCSIVRVVLGELRRHGVIAGLRMARRALWLLFVVPLRR